MSETNPASPAEQSAAIRRRIVGPFLGFLLLAQLAHLLFLLTACIPFHMDLTFPEGSVVHRAQAAALGLPVYLDWREWPHIFTPYGPLTYYPVGWIARLFGDPSDLWSIYLIGRSQSWLALIGFGSLLFLFGRRLGLSRMLALMAVGCVEFWLPMMNYCVSYRPDGPAAALACLSLWFVVRAPARPATIAASLGALYLSLWFKPTTLGMVVIVAAWIWTSFGTLRMLAIMACFAVLGLLPLWALDRMWGGMLIHNLIGFNGNAGYTLFYLRDFFIYPRPSLAIILAGAAIAALHLLRGSDRGARWLSAAALVNLAVTFLQYFKVGADINYFIFPYPLLTLLVFDGAMKLWRGELSIAPALREAALWLLAIVPVVLLQINLLGNTRNEYENLSTTWRPLYLERIVRQWPGPILVPNSYLAVMCTDQPTNLDRIAYAAMVRQGLIDPEILREKVRRREFSHILIYPEEIENKLESSDGLISLGQLIAQPLGENYRELGPLSVYALYVRK